ncbi:MAG: small multi-drug export protein [Clostridia bacterium]|nr:small multi-drug export protein [Clostridia bacterium]
MTEFLHNLFATLFDDNVILATILISMLPIIELRGGIPFGMATHIWGTKALSYAESLLFAFLGSSSIVFLLAIIIKPLIDWLKKTKLCKKLAIWFEQKILGKTQKIQEDSKNQTSLKKSKWKKLLGVFIFVAIPLPLTGVWTGTCIAVFLGLSYLETCGSVILGNLCAGLITTLISLIFKDNTIYVLYIFLGITLALILAGAIKIVVRNIKQKKQQDTSDQETTQI